MRPALFMNDIGHVPNGHLEILQLQNKHDLRSKDCGN